MTLSVGEWRLFLLSDCIKYYPDVREHTKLLRKEGKRAILEISNTDVKELNIFISEEDISKIRQQMRKEWRFTGKVIDNGRGIKTTCEYCQHQQIRYRYMCRNDKTDVWLSLGSVCVGNIIYGEEQMKNKDFASKFTSELDSLKSKAMHEENRQNRVQERRGQQLPVVSLCIKFLENNCGVHNSDFLNSIKKQWAEGRDLTDKQLSALCNWCSKEKAKLLKEAK